MKRHFRRSARILALALPREALRHRRRTGELRFGELAANGSNYVGFKAPDTLPGDQVWTLPGADGTSGQLLSTSGSGALATCTSM